MLPASYGEVIVIFAYFAIFNVFLAYGMETTFFRFYKEADQRKKVVTTSLLSIFATTLSFPIIGVIFKETFSHLLEINPKYLSYAFVILTFDASVFILLSWSRVHEMPMRYAIFIL